MFYFTWPGAGHRLWIQARQHPEIVPPNTEGVSGLYYYDSL